MAEHQPTNQQNSADEIDLGQLFNMIGKGFQRLGRFILRVFLYLKKNALILLGLMIVGAAIGFGLNQIVAKRLKVEVIVKPNLESKNYLYDVINEIQANLEAGDTSFFRNLGIDLENLKGFEITVEPVGDKSNKEQDLKYLELLEKFQNSGIVGDVVRSEILNKSSLNHRITFYFKDAGKGRDIAKKLIAYINSNEYFNGLVDIKLENARERIERNEFLLEQIDGLIANYSKKMAQADNQFNEGRIILDNEEKLDIKGLLELKTQLARDIEGRRLDLQEQKEAISIVNFGRIQQVKKSLFGKNIILIPLILVGLFFLMSIVKFLDKKAKEI